MYIDIHVHKRYEGENILLLQNLFPDETDAIVEGRYYSVGLHPWYINEHSLEHEINRVHSAVKSSAVVAIGEIGLDAKIQVPASLQSKAFMMQLDIAGETLKPVIIHCVKAYNELLSIRKNADRKIPWIIHWFNGSRQMAGDLIGKNCYLSFGYALFQENSKAFSAFKTLPHDRIFLETDDVGISIKEVYEKASGLLNITTDKLREQIVKNFEACFGALL